MILLIIVCEEIEALGVNPRRHGENMKTPHRKNWAEPESFCEATVETTGLDVNWWETVILIRLCIPLYG